MADDDQYKDSVIKQIDELFSTENIVIIYWILFVPSLLAFIYGVISWCIIPKFRNFRNYVFFSAILANVIRLFVFELCVALVNEETVMRYPITRVIPVTLTMYCSLSFHCWLLVLCFYFYIDLVYVFRVEIRRRYLKSAVFAWGLPLVSLIVYFIAALYCFVLNSSEIVPDYAFHALTKTILIIPVMINFTIYISVVFSLFRGCKTAAQPAISRWCRFYIATLIFVLSNVLQLTVLLEILDCNIFIIVVIGELGMYLNTLALDVFVLIVKSNRELWQEFIRRRLNLSLP